MNRRSFFLRALATGAAMIPIKFKPAGWVSASTGESVAASVLRGEEIRKAVSADFDSAYHMCLRAFEELQGEQKKHLAWEVINSPVTPAGRLFRNLEDAFKKHRYINGGFMSGFLDYDEIAQPLLDREIAARRLRSFVGGSLPAGDQQDPLERLNGTPTLTWFDTGNEAVDWAYEYRQDKGQAQINFTGYFPDGRLSTAIT